MPGKYLPVAVRTTAPTRLLAFSVDTTPGNELDQQARVGRRFHSVHVRYAVYRRSGWNGHVQHRFKRTAEFWKWLYGLCGGKSLLTMVSPCCVDDLTLLRLWEEVDDGEIRFWSTPRVQVGTVDESTGFGKPFKGRLLTGNPPDIIHAMTAAGPFKAVSLRNFIQSPLRDQAAFLGVGWRKAQPGESRSLVREWKAEHVTAVTLEAVKGLADWWRAGECGPWRDTTPQLSMSLFKRKFLGHKLLIHEDADASRIERDAMHGARLSVWYYGDIGSHPGNKRVQQPPPDPSTYPPEPGPVWRVDVRSQYPFLMHQNAFPACFMGYLQRSTPAELRAMLRLWGCIARVLIRTDVAEYPLKKTKHEPTTYPTGEFWTTLCGPELVPALDAGHVVRVGEVCRYEMKPVFKGFAEWLWERRLEYQRRGNPTGELWVKLMSNSFAGKLAQKPGRWVPDPTTKPRKKWGITYISFDGKLTAERGVGGQREVYDPTISTRAVAPAAFAYLTAFGRMMMRDLRGLLAPREVYAQHTDCLFVSESGYERLCTLGKIEPHTFGGLKPTGPIEYMRFLGPSHRYADGRWTAGGIAEGFHVMKHCKFRTSVRYNPHRKTMPSARGRVRDLTLIRSLESMGRPSTVAPDGWAVPFHEHYIPPEPNRTPEE